MGARLRDGIRQAAQLIPLVLALGLAGCGVDDGAAPGRARRLLDDGGHVIARELEGLLAAADRALTELEGALAAAGDEPDARFDALEALRERHGLSGLAWEGPGGEHIWAGRPLAPLPVPAPPPWDESFRHGRLGYHAGPFLRALVVGPGEALGGHGLATLVLEEREPNDSDTRPFARRWLGPLDLFEVRLLPPAEVQSAAKEDPTARRVPIRGPRGEVVLAADLRVLGLEALRERLEADQASLEGVVLLLLLLGAVVVLGRLFLPRVPSPSARWLAAGALVLVARGCLRLLDLPSRFPPLMEAFSPSEFAVGTPLGWLGSPGDFALTAVAYLLVAICLTHALRGLPLPRRAAGRGVTVAVALAAAGLACGLWLLVIDRAVAGGQTPFFEADTFVPAAAAALMLTGLVATTATTYLVVHGAVRRAWRSLARPGPGWRRVLLGALAVGATALGAGAFAPMHWVVLVLPVVAAFLAGRGEGRIGLALPSRVLVLSVLATALAYPVLWARLGERENATLEETLDEVLGSEDIARAGVAAALADAATDADLGAALREAAAGGRPEGMALALWLRTASQWQRRPAVVAVLDARGRTLDSFALATLPRRMIPTPQPPTQGETDEEILVARGGPGHLRCVVGRARLRDEAGQALGHVVITVPDRLDLQLKGLAGLVAFTRPAGPPSLADDQRVQYAQLHEGAVVASSDPALSRAPGSFGPGALATLDAETPTLRWMTDAAQGFARWDPVRGDVFALRQPRPALGEALLALARLVVVGVGLGLLTAVACLLGTLGRLRLHLHHKILVSYFVISVIPLVLLGAASARETQQRHDARLADRLQTDVARARGELELMGAGVFDGADSNKLEEWAPQRRHDILLYRDGELQAASRTGLVAAELLSRQLPASAYRATVLEGRQIIRREAVYAGRRVWFAYAPVLDGGGRTRATVGVPLLYEADRLEEQVTVTGSVLLAAYMLTLVLVLVGGIYAARRLTRPLATLADGTKQVAAGDLAVELAGEGADEFGQLVAAFNAMTRDLRRTTDRAVRAERESAWRRMASQVAHEIKNPLTPMRLMIQQMEADVARDPDHAQEAIRRTAPVLLRQIEGLDRIARDFANFARLPKRRTTRLDAGALVREVTALHSGASAHGIDVRCEVEGDLPPVYWDEEELRRVLLNVVLNAVESIQGAGEVVLHASAETRDGTPGVLVTVRDDGAGIPPENLERLFEPQFSTKTHGTGLGLAIVSRIVQDMGGRVDVASHPPRGTTFSLWWPSRAP